METEGTIIEYFDLNDGEVFIIQQVDPDTGETLDQIMMERQTAVEIAHDILRMLNG